MNIFLRATLICLTVLNGRILSSTPPKFILADTIQAVVCGPEGADIITATDVQRPGIDGSRRSLEDKVMERRMYQDAVQFKMVPEKEVVQKNLQTVQRENNLTQDQLKEIFRAGGYSWEEGLQQFETMMAVNQIVSFKVMSRLIVPESEIVAFHEENPKIIEASYYLRRAEVPISVASTKSSLKQKLLSQEFYESLDWSDPFWIDHGDVAPEKQYIYKMIKNQIALNAVEGGFELFELVDKKDECIVPLEQRYDEIVNLLRQPKHKELMGNYKKELFNNAVVVYLPLPTYGG